MPQNRGRREDIDNIDLNRASAATLTQIEGIDGQRAHLIVEAREKRGAFHSWEELEEVEGIGETLVERIKARAHLDDGGEQSALSPDEEEGEGLDPEALIDALTTLAELDSEAVAAYQVGARSAEDTQLRDQLKAFGRDHQRHVSDLNELLERAGSDAVEDTEPEEGLLAHLADTAATLGDRGVLMAMIGNEQLTSRAYAAALELAGDSEVRTILEGGVADERRHLRWLEEAGARWGLAPGAAARH
jgi:competence ComEA-like helix-hairpin-helix protein